MCGDDLQHDLLHVRRHTPAPLITCDHDRRPSRDRSARGIDGFTLFDRLPDIYGQRLRSVQGTLGLVDISGAQIIIWQLVL